MGFVAIFDQSVGHRSFANLVPMRPVEKQPGHWGDESIGFFWLYKVSRRPIVNSLWISAVVGRNDRRSQEHSFNQRSPERLVHGGHQEDVQSAHAWCDGRSEAQEVYSVRYPELIRARSYHFAEIRFVRRRATEKHAREREVWVAPVKGMNRLDKCHRSFALHQIANIPHETRIEGKQQLLGQIASAGLAVELRARMVERAMEHRKLVFDWKEGSGGSHEF